MNYDTTYTSRKDRKWNATFIYFAISIALVFGLIGASFYSESSWGIFSFKTDLSDNWTDIFTKYLFIIIALERAAAVWIGLKRNQNKRAWDIRVNRVRKLLNTTTYDPASESYKSDLSIDDLMQLHNRESKIINEMKQKAQSGEDSFLGIIEPDSRISDDSTDKERKEIYLSYLKTVEQIYDFKRTKYEEITYKSITRIVFIGGIILSIIGLSILGDIVDIRSLDEEAEGFTSQLFVYRFTDILITGGLLGGGSKSFSVFLNTINSALNEVKKNQG